MSKLKDGTYSENYTAFPIMAVVDVDIESHRIRNIKLIKHEHGQGAEVIPQKVVEAQSLEVGAVSGATYSSKVILKAIESALIKAGM